MSDFLEQPTSQEKRGERFGVRDFAPGGLAQGQAERDAFQGQEFVAVRFEWVVLKLRGQEDMHGFGGIPGSKVEATQRQHLAGVMPVSSRSSRRAQSSGVSCALSVPAGSSSKC